MKILDKETTESRARNPLANTIPITIILALLLLSFASATTYTIEVTNTNTTVTKDLSISLGLTNFTCNEADYSDLIISPSDTFASMLDYDINTTYGIVVVYYPSIATSATLTFYARCDEADIAAETSLLIYRDDFNVDTSGNWQTNYIGTATVSVSDGKLICQPTANYGNCRLKHSAFLDSAYSSRWFDILTKVTNSNNGYVLGFASGNYGNVNSTKLQYLGGGDPHEINAFDDTTDFGVLVPRDDAAYIRLSAGRNDTNTSWYYMDVNNKSKASPATLSNFYMGAGGAAYGSVGYLEYLDIYSRHMQRLYTGGPITITANTPPDHTPTGKPILNLSSGNYSTNQTIGVSNVTGATGYEWRINNSIVQNTSSTIYTTSWTTYNLYVFNVTAYNGTYYGQTSDKYIYLFNYTHPIYICGDNVINQINESCDGTDLNSLICADIGPEYDSGNLTCSDDCTTLITTNCSLENPPPPINLTGELGEFNFTLTDTVTPFNSCGTEDTLLTQYLIRYSVLILGILLFALGFIKKNIKIMSFVGCLVIILSGLLLTPCQGLLGILIILLGIGLGILTISKK